MHLYLPSRDSQGDHPEMLNQCNPETPPYQSLLVLQGDGRPSKDVRFGQNLNAPSRNQVTPKPRRQDREVRDVQPKKAPLPTFVTPGASVNPVIVVSPDNVMDS